jgi:DNA segregation ATPase FtsK/SpoIIIE, S-DNA-T family
MAAKENTVKDRSEKAEKQDKSVEQGLRKDKRSKEAAPAPEPAPKSGKIGQVAGFVRSERGRKVLGLLMILVSLIALVACISHFFTGYSDQTMSGKMPANWLGGLGAWISHILVFRGFGLFAVLIPIYTGLWGFAVLERKYSPFLFKILKYFFFGVIWGSVTLAFLSLVIWGKASLLGGGFGLYVNEMLNFPIGRVGTGLVIVISFLIFLVVNFNVDLPFSNLIVKKPVEEPEVAPEPVAEEDQEPANKSKNGVTVPGDGLEEEEEEDAKGDEFQITVRPVEEVPVAEQKPPVVAPLPENIALGDKVSLEINAVPETRNPKNKEPEFEINLPSPDEIPEIGTYRDSKTMSGDFDFVIEDTQTRDVPTADKVPVLPINGDNIHRVEENTFEKIVPEDSLETLNPEDEVADWAEYDPTLELSTYQYPTIDLLEQRDGSQSREVNRGELEENKNKIVQTLQHYKIDITSIKATIGPTVTLYEIVPAPGVRISKIKNLEDDIALSLSALGIRIIAPIPGKGTIGIEIPNSKPEIVSMRSVMSTEKFRDSKAELPLVLGRTISNEVYIADLSKMPHLLIAGATGQGKSVGINGIISSILYKKHPSQVKFVLIDPKKVELSLYSNLESHFLAMLETSDEPIITDTKQVIGVLNSLCKEMDSRYDLLKKAGVRNLLEYNAKFISRRLNPKKGHRFLPYIVLIIDEFADLMMTAGKEIETPIARLAQLARAIGIHLILATQRPSVNVITGIIKANFPARISFRVTSKVDSRTILDTGGADQLVGRGDLLLSTGSEIVRIQNAFIDTPEVESLVNFISEQRGYPTPYYLPEVPIEGEDDDIDEDDLGERDDFFSDAARLVVKHQQGSTSLIQRRLKLGYNRAGRIIDQLEKAGVVGPFQGSKAREVLVHDEYTLEQILNQLN